MPTLTYSHWRDVPANTWRWPNFSAAEIACRGTGAIKINTEAMDKLQALRDRLGKPLIVRSAYRSPEHNRAVGGAPAWARTGWAIRVTKAAPAHNIPNRAKASPKAIVVACFCNIP